MNNSQLSKQLKRHEDLRLKPYKCTANKITIGYGRNLEQNGITKLEAEGLLQNDIVYFFDILPNKIEFFHLLSKPRADVLVNMAFNLGVNGLLRFKKMLAAVEAGDYLTASKEMLNSKWAEQVGDRALELSMQMEKGEYM
jgi:lysozyme